MQYSKIISIIGIILLTGFFAGCNSKIIFEQPHQKTEAEIIQEKLAQRTPKEPLKIGFITDVHSYGKKVGANWQINWRSKKALERFIDKMNNEFKPDFVVEDGDLVDGKDKNSLEDWKIVDQMMKNLQAPYHHVMGNHEMRSFDEQTWLQLTGYDKPYYYFDSKGYRIIVLDGNHLPGGKHTSPEKEYYPGALGLEQWKWLEKTLKESALQDKDPIVFLHQPPIKTDAKPNWELFPNGGKLHELFNKYKVRAVFSGHIERFCDIKDGSTEYFVLQGMWKSNSGLKPKYRFADAGNFYYITINPDKIEVKAEYRVFTKKAQSPKLNKQKRLKDWETLTLNPQFYNCQDGQQLDPSKKNLSIEEETGDSKVKTLDNSVINKNTKTVNNETKENQEKDGAENN